MESIMPSIMPGFFFLDPVHRWQDGVMCNVYVLLDVRTARFRGNILRNGTFIHFYLVRQSKTRNV